MFSISFRTVWLCVGLYAWALVPQRTVARFLEILPGGDGNLYGTENSIHDLCLSESFSFSNLSNLVDWNTTEWYANWTRAQLPKYLGTGNGSQTVIQITGAKLFGAGNMACDLARGPCESMPSCQEIAEYMGLNPSVTINEIQGLELRHRYILSRMINSQILYFNELDEGLAQAEAEVQLRIPEIVQSFTTQKDQKAAEKCKLHKQAIMAIGNSIFALLTAFSGGTTAIASAGVAGAATAASKTILSRVMSSKVMSSKVSGPIQGAGISIAQQVVSNFGYSFPTEQEGVNPTNYGNGQVFWTQLDRGMCEGVQDQNDLNVIDLSAHVSFMFKTMRDTVAKQAYDFGKDIGNATNAANGQTAQILELKKFQWLLVYTQPNALKNDLSWRMSKQVTENLVSQALRSAQCYIQCSPTTEEVARYQCSEASRTSVSTPSGSDHDLATFGPTQDFCGRRNDLESCPTIAASLFGHPNLVCRFACLKQDLNDHTPVWPPSLQKMTHSRFQLEPHLMFTDAVLAHTAGVGYFFNPMNEDALVQSNVSAPAFRLPVCISDTAFLLGNPITDVMRQGEFEFLCGDWRANETRQFLDGMPIGRDSANWKAGDLNDLYGRCMNDRIKEDMIRLKDAYPTTDPRTHSIPITHFLVYCEAGLRFEPDYRELELSPNPICEALKTEIKDMSPMEATFWFCYGPTTVTVANADPYDLCDEFTETHQLEADKYKKDMETWTSGYKADPKTVEYPFRYNISHQYPEIKNPEGSVNKFNMSNVPKALELFLEFATGTLNLNNLTRKTH